MFFTENQALLSDFARMSQAAGSRADFVQGGGGNTSVKLPGGLMAVKASGFRLSDIRPDKAYAVLDYEALRRFYFENEPETLGDVEKEGAACARENVKQIEGLDALRPSVEAGFHAILGTFVLHTHSVYVDLAVCSAACREIAALAFSGAGYGWGWVDYTDPGARLTFAIRDELRRVRRETGRAPAVILMQNHGVIVHADTASECLAIHTDANERLARFFSLSGTAFPEVAVRELAGGLYCADTPYLKRQLQNCAYTQRQLMEQPLYPDQLVFLTDTFTMDAHGIPEGRAVASTKTGELVMNMPLRQAQALSETLTAVFFVMEHIKAAGYPLSTMGEAAKNFITNWESEKYRKALAGKDGLP